MVSRRFEHAAARHLERVGRDVTLTNYTDDGTTDEHGDPSRTVDSTETHPAILRQPTEEVTAPGPDGQQVAVEVVVFVPETATVHEADDDERYATELTDSRTGRTYRALAVWNEGNGQVRVTAESVS